MNKKTLDELKVQMPDIESIRQNAASPLTFDFSSIEMPDIEPLPPELSKDRIDYEDTVLKDFADEIKAVQVETNRQLSKLIEENRKSDLISRRLVAATLIVSALTLIATVAGIIH